MNEFIAFRAGLDTCSQGKEKLLQPKLQTPWLVLIGYSTGPCRKATISEVMNNMDRLELKRQDLTNHSFIHQFDDSVCGHLTHIYNSTHVEMFNDHTFSPYFLTYHFCIFTKHAFKICFESFFQMSFSIHRLHQCKIWLCDHTPGI